MNHSFPILDRLFRIGCIALMLTLTAVTAMAQRNQTSSSFDEDYIFWGYPNMYLSYQAKMAYPLIDQMLLANPPEKEPNSVRQLALVTLDQFLHETDYQRRDAFYPFITARMAHVFDGMDEPAWAGVRIYKLYNSGFILRTLKTTVAIDLVPGGSTTKPFLTDSVVSELASRCDALLVTNTDSRHANRNIAKAFVEAGKFVYAPQSSTGLWNNLDEELLQIVGTDTAMTLETKGMTLHILPGHNGRAQNNIYVMDFQGRGVVAHTGAQDNDNDWTWIDQVHSQYDIDILLTKSQNTNLESILRGFQPRLVITAHENEMESSVDKRESYWATQKRLQNVADLGIPNVIMTWGESFEYADRESDNISSSANKVLKDGVLYIEREGSLYTPAGMKVK